MPWMCYASHMNSKNVRYVTLTEHYKILVVMSTFVTSALNFSEILINIQKFALKKAFRNVVC